MERVFTGSFVLVDSQLDAERKRATEIVRTKAGRYSVAFLINVKDIDSVVLVGQQRTAMISPENPEGFIVEVPAGRCDRPESVKATIAREAAEEVGAESISEDQIELLNGGLPLALSPGIIDELMYLGYIEINEDQIEADRVFGVAEEGESIIRRLVRAEDACNMPCSDMKTKTLLLDFALRRAQRR